MDNIIKLYRVHQITFFFWNIFSNFFFYLKVQCFRSIMETNFIQIAASASHAVAQTIGPIFKHIIDLKSPWFSR